MCETGTCSPCLRATSAMLARSAAFSSGETWPPAYCARSSAAACMQNSLWRLPMHMLQTQVFLPRPWRYQSCSGFSLARFSLQYQCTISVPQKLHILLRAVGRTVKAQRTPAGHDHSEGVRAQGIDVDVDLVDESGGAGEVSFETGHADELTLHAFRNKV